jgi:hypothetical protein
LYFLIRTAEFFFIVDRKAPVFGQSLLTLTPEQARVPVTARGGFKHMNDTDLDVGDIRIIKKDTRPISLAQKKAVTSGT